MVLEPIRRHLRKLLVFAVAAALLAPVATAEAITLPAGFADELVTTISGPSALAFTPDGRMLIASKPGTLRVYTTGAGLLPTPALSLTAKACSNSERGLLGVAVDPAFASNHFIYLYYTFNKFNTCPTNAAQTPVNRVARFVLQNSNVVDPATETVLVDNIPSYGGIHNAGDVQFGKDGNLYVSVGDGGCDYAGGGGCSATNDASRDQHVLVGKILRITSSGGIPPDNPYTGLNTARCNLTGSTNPGMRCQETYAWGLRNPFRIAVDPNAASTRLFINDVGQSTWDEIDQGAGGADYGWNVREGHCANGSTTNCGAPPAGMTNPIFDYGHGDGCASITGGAFVPNNAWPAPYAGTYLFGDYVCGKIFQLLPKTGGGYNRLTFADGLGSSSAVHLTFGPNGALYYTNFASGGTVHRIVRTTGNRPPIADFSATPTSGPTPLTVNFDASLSSDPDSGDTLTYIWNFDDGSGTTQASPTVSHTYTANGTFAPTLTVRDNHGTSSAPDTTRIDAGNDAPVPTITTPSGGQRFAVGETIQLRGSATDAQDGTLPDSALSWTVIRHHAAHTHPYLGPVTGNSASFVGPPPEDLSSTTDSSLEVRLAATDSNGVTTTATRTVGPKLVTLSFATSPTGLSLLLNGTTFTAPQSWTLWEGWDVTAGAPSQGSYAFSSWSDGGAATHTIHTPASPAAYTASFVASSTGNLVANPSFEAGLSGWGSFQGSLSRVAVSGGPDGGWVARATRASGTNYSVGDNEGTAPTVASVTAGSTYVASCYVRAANAQASGRPGRIVLRERVGSFGTVVKETAASFTLSTTFKRVSVAAVAVTTGNTMGLRCEQTSAVAGDAFDADLMTVARATTVGGNTTAGTVWSNASPNYKRASAMTLSAPRELVSLQAYLDGKATTTGSQVLSGVLYAGTASGPTTRVATTSAVTISAGQAAGWVKLGFSTPVRLAAGTYWIGLHTGGSAAVLRFAAQAVSGALRFNGDSYSDGAAATFGTTTTDAKSLSLYAVGSWTP